MPAENIHLQMGFADIHDIVIDKNKIKGYQYDDKWLAQAYIILM